MYKLILFSLVSLTASCHLPKIVVLPNITELLPVGTTLSLTQTLQVPKERSFIYIAKGKVAPLKNYNTVDIYQPYCMFRLHAETKKIHHVFPDQFEVTRIVEWEGYYSHLDKKKFYSVNNGWHKLTKVNSADDGGSSIVMYATIFSLHSDKQPEVKELVCGHWDDHALVEPLTLKEIKFAVGDLITVNIKNTEGNYI